MAYASRTGTRRNLAALRDAGWRILVSARGVLRSEGFPYALDNGAWTSFQKGEPFDVDAFERALWMLGRDADWIAAPDIVGGGAKSLEMSESWLHRLRFAKLVLIPVQDGMKPEDVKPLLSKRVGLFLGGSTDWKLSTMLEWGALAHDVGCYYHVARVNTMKRIYMAAEAGADSIDGTSVTRYACTLPKLDRALRQQSFTWGAA